MPPSHSRIMDCPTLDLATEAARTRPDYVVFAPRSTDRSTRTTGNEHLLVEKLPNGNLFAVWTQSSFEGEADQHIVFSRSTDDGKTWSPPVTLAGGETMASWAFPVVARSGRVYVIFNRHTGVNDIFTHTTGRMACKYTDDEGATWSEEAILSMPHSSWGNPDPAVPPNWIVWQKPVRLPDGAQIVGFTRWVSPKVMTAPIPNWWASPSVVEFLRFENIDEGPAPQDLELSFLAGGPAALQVSLRDHPETPVAQEPSLVVLPDGRLFCVMRTTQGSPYYAVSEDRGTTWSQPARLLQYDDGPALCHPLSPCPIYPIGPEDFVLLYHNHDGNFLNWGFNDTHKHRRPVCLARGVFRPGARQPIWFSEPWFLFDNGGIPILRTDLAMYASTTPTAKGLVLWYPDRKFFLLGKRLDRAEVKSLSVRPN